MTPIKLLLLPGDGIGPEVMAEVKRVIAWLEKAGRAKFEVEEDLVGGCAYDAHGEAISDAAMAKARAADAVMFGAVGGPKWDTLPSPSNPKPGFCACARISGCSPICGPRICFDALKDASSLKPEIVAGLDILIVRELTGGVYFGEPKEITTLPDGQKRAVDTQVYTTSEIERIARVAFELARAARQTRRLGRKVQRHGDRRAVARSRRSACTTRSFPMSSSRTSWRTIAPCSWCAIPSSST